MANNTLHDALAGFTGVTNIKLDSEKRAILSKQFSELATKIFNTGYFEVNGCRRIYPTVIEFYYHEEVEGGLLDPIMYHTNLNNKEQVHEAVSKVTDTASFWFYTSCFFERSHF